MRAKRLLGTAAFVACVLVFGAVSATLAEGVRRRIKFPRGRTSTTVSNAVLREEIDEYLLGAKAGQRMTIEISSVEGNAAFLIHTPGGEGTLAGAGEGDD